jgi:hypothetical protein
MINILTNNKTWPCDHTRPIPFAYIYTWTIWRVLSPSNSDARGPRYLTHKRGGMCKCFRTRSALWSKSAAFGWTTASYKATTAVAIEHIIVGHLCCWPSLLLAKGCHQSLEMASAPRPSHRRNGPPAEPAANFVLVRTGAPSSGAQARRSTRGRFSDGHDPGWLPDRKVSSNDDSCFTSAFGWGGNSFRNSSHATWTSSAYFLTCFPSWHSCTCTWVSTFQSKLLLQPSWHLLFFQRKKSTTSVAPDSPAVVSHQLNKWFLNLKVNQFLTAPTLLNR